MKTMLIMSGALMLALVFIPAATKMNGMTYKEYGEYARWSCNDDRVNLTMLEYLRNLKVRQYGKRKTICLDLSPKEFVKVARELVDKEYQAIKRSPLSQVGRRINKTIQADLFRNLEKEYPCE